MTNTAKSYHPKRYAKRTAFDNSVIVIAAAAAKALRAMTSVTQKVTPV